MKKHPSANLAEGCFFVKNYLFAHSSSLTHRIRIPPIKPTKKMSRMPQIIISDLLLAVFILLRVIPPKIRGRIAIAPNTIPRMINTFAAVFIFQPPLLIGLFRLRKTQAAGCTPPQKYAAPHTLR